MRKVILVGLTITAMMVVIGSASWAVPDRISFSGRLTDSNTGNAVPEELTRLTFTFWDQEDGGNQLGGWSENHDRTPKNGIVSVLLGDNRRIPSSIFYDNDNVFMQIVINETNTLRPRQRIVSVPYAYRAARADSLTGGIPWTESGGNVYRVAGNVGIGPDNPGFKLDVQKDDGVLAEDGIGHHGVAWMSRQSANDGPGLYMGYVADGANVTGAFIRQGGTGNGILDIGTLGSKRAIRIDSSGNVGINKTDLDNRAKLQIGADWGHLRLYEQDQPYPGEFTQLDRNGGDFNIAHYVGENKTYVHVLTGARNGNVGIGTDSPGAELEVKSEGGQPDIWLNRGTNASAAVFSLRTGGVNDWSILTPSGGDNLYIYNKNNNKLMEFTQGGTVLMDNPTHLLEVTNTRIGTISPASAADWSRKVPMIRTLMLYGTTNNSGVKYWTHSQTGLGGNEVIISLSAVVFTSNDNTVATKIEQADPDPVVKFWGYNSGVPGEVSVDIGRNEARNVRVFIVYEGL